MASYGLKWLRSVRALVAIGFIFLLVPLHFAHAQDIENLSEYELDLLPEIIVTARLREENLQEVPISAQVIAGQLQEQNVNNLSDLSQLVPGLQIQPVGRSTDMYLRGIGSGNNASFNQSLGTVIDGIYHGRSRTSGATFLDIDRIEILKGPQSTFFGNNAIAGALNIVSKTPLDTFDSTVRAAYGDYGQYTFESAVGGKLIQGLTARAAVMANGQDGYLRNVNDGSDQPNEDNQAARITLLYEPSAALDITAKVEGSKNEQQGGLVQQLLNCPPPSPFVAAGFCNVGLSLGVPTGLDNDQTGFDPGQGSSLDTVEGVLTVNYRPSAGLTLTSITGYYEYEYDLDVAAAPLGPPLTASVPEKFHQFSQELRLASDVGGTFEYLVGLYFQDQGLNAEQETNFFFLTPTLQSAPPFAALAPFAPLGQEIRFSLPERTSSVFGSVGVRATDSLKFDVGLRASEVEKSIDQTLSYGTATQTYGGFSAIPDNLQSVAARLGLGVPGTQSGSRTDRALMPSAAVQYNIAPEIMTYASYVRGFKAGGFNGTSIDGVAANLPYDPETVDAYEVGLKTRWNDGKLLVNLDVFRSEYSDLQSVANSFDASGAIISLVKNAASSVSQGVELQTRWLITPKLSLVVEGTYLDAYYESYPNAGATQAQQLAGIRIQDLSGRPTPLAPEWNGSITGAYTVPFGDGYKLTTKVTGIFSSSYFLSAPGTDDDLLSQGSYRRLDVSLGLHLGPQWVLEAIGKNLTDENILISGSPVPTSLGSVIVHKEMPRSIVGQVRYSF